MQCGAHFQSGERAHRLEQLALLRTPDRRLYIFHVEFKLIGDEKVGRLKTCRNKYKWNFLSPSFVYTKEV